MQHQGIRSEPLDQAPAVVGGHPLVELDRPQVGEEQDVGRQRSDIEGVQHLGMLEQDPTRAQPHGQADLLGHPSQGSVDASGLAGAPRHRRDQERRPQPPVEQPHRGVDLVQVELRQGPVQEAVLVEAVADPFAVDIALQVDADVVGLAAGSGDPQPVLRLPGPRRGDRSISAGRDSRLPA